MNSNSKIRSEALNSLNGEWGLSIVLYLIYLMVNSLCVIPLIGGVFWFVIGLPLSYSLSIAFLRIARGEGASITNLADGFKRFEEVLVTLLIRWIYIFLWSLLFIVPGIVKACSYAMTPYILADTELTNDAAIERSMELMRGHKMRYFLMELGFWMLAILSILTLGIVMIFITPYWQTSRAKFYLDLIKE